MLINEHNHFQDETIFGNLDISVTDGYKSKTVLTVEELADYKFIVKNSTKKSKKPIKIVPRFT